MHKKKKYTYVWNFLRVQIQVNTLCLWIFFLLIFSIYFKAQFYYADCSRVVVFLIWLYHIVPCCFSLPQALCQTPAEFWAFSSPLSHKVDDTPWQHLLWPAQV